MSGWSAGKGEREVLESWQESKGMLPYVSGALGRLGGNKGALERAGTSLLKRVGSG